MSVYTAAQDSSNGTHSAGKGPNRGLPNIGEGLPDLAWPTIVLYLASLTILASATPAMVIGQLPLWLGIPANTVAMFAMFTVLHDAAHHSISKADWVNELLGRLSMPFVVVYGSFGLFRFIHIEHHRNTNEAMGIDPDAWTSAGPAWQQPLRWMTLDLWYVAFYAQHVKHRPKNEVLETAAIAAFVAIGFAWLCVAGYWFWPLMTFLLPQRIAITLLAWWFDWLPHHGLSATARENRFQATRNRVSMEWLFTPVMLSQNYHLVHHLYPSIPFYRYLPVWRRHEQAFLVRQPALSTVWGRDVSIDEYRTWRGLPEAGDSEDMAVGNARKRATFYELTVSDIRPITNDSVSVTLQVPEFLRETFRYRQGQHITLRCPQLKDEGGAEIRRNYSICASVNDETLRIGVKRIPGGAFSTYAAEHLQVGDVLEVMPPSGRFFTPLDAKHSKLYVAISAGSGITPILSIIKTTLETELESKFVLLYGNRSLDSIMFLDEFQALKHRYPERFQILHFLSDAPEDADNLNGSLQREEFYGQLDRELLRGRITVDKIEALMGAYIASDDVDEWFLCGPQALIEDSVETLHRHGVDDAHIHRELFIAAPKRKPGEADVAAEAGPPSAITVRAGGEETHFDLAQGGETVLDAAMRLRGDLPYSCLGGACGTCRARLTSGTVEMEQNMALDADELEAGYVLTCQSRPTSGSVTLDYDT